MKKSALLSLAAAVLFSAVPQLYAKGIFITPGARSNGLGAAYVAVADDASAIYWNPAGLTQLAGSGAAFSMFYVKNSAKSNTSLNNIPKVAGVIEPNPADGDFPLPLVYAGLEPDAYSSKNFETTAPVPFLAGYNAYKDFVLAGGVYCVGGGGGKWNDTVAALNMVDRIDASIDASYMFIVYNLSAAKEIMPKLSAGIGVDLVTMTDKTNVQKDYISSNPISYSLAVDKQAFGYGMQYNGGILYRPIDAMRLGAVIRSGSKITLHGKAKYDQTGLGWLNPLDPSLADRHDRIDYDQNYIYPLTYGLGASYDPSPKWTLAAGLDFNQYSTGRNEVTYETPLTGVFDNTKTSSGWKDTMQYRIGAEYRTSEKLALRAGMQTDPSQLKDDNLTLINLDQYDMTYYTIGAGYDFSAATVELCYAKGYSNKPEKAGRTYEYNLDIIRAGIKYTF